MDPSVEATSRCHDDHPSSVLDSGLVGGSGVVAGAWAVILLVPLDFKTHADF